MGIDGHNTLQIRGPPADLDKIDQTKCWIFDISGTADCSGNVEFMMLHEEYFKVGMFERATKNYMIIFYDFRNEPPHEYIEALLKMYPRCWMKNSYRTEDGNCGFMLAHYNEGILAKQEHEWYEMGDEESANLD